jgi:hypothetical protein
MRPALGRGPQGSRRFTHPARGFGHPHAEPTGLRYRSDITAVLLWRIPHGDVLDQGALITIDLANGVRLATLHQDIKDFADRRQRGIPAAVSALGHITGQVCLLVERYQRTNPDYQPHLPAAESIPGVDHTAVRRQEGHVSDPENESPARVRNFTDLIEPGEFKPVIDRTYPLDHIVEAYRFVETGQKIGNVIISVDLRLRGQRKHPGGCCRDR